MDGGSDEEGLDEFSLQLSLGFHSDNLGRVRLFKFIPGQIEGSRIWNLQMNGQG